MPIVDETMGSSLPSTNQLGSTNSVTFRSIETIPPASRPLQPPPQSIPTTSHLVAQSRFDVPRQRQSFPLIRRSTQPSVSQFNGAPHHVQMADMTNERESSNTELALQLPTYTNFPQHDYAALAADAPDITSFMDSFPGHLQGMKLIKDPPDLDRWRHILFHVDDMITLSEEQYAISLGSASLLTQRLKSMNV